MRFAFSLNACVLFLAVPSLCLAAEAASPTPCVPTQTPIHDGVLYVLMGVVVAAVFIINSNLMSMLSNDEGWSLAKALSEPQPVEVTTPTPLTTDGQNTPKVGDGQKPASQQPGAANTEKVFAPSTSRLIAMFGTVIVSMLFMGYGVVVVWYLGKTGCMPGLENLTTFLVGGSSLFAPYVFNKLTNAITFKQ